jgi:carboxyl-terminal processing protease
MQGSFGGIGAQVDYKDGRVIVSSPLKNSPAEKAGIKAGDIIVSVDGTSTLSMTTDQTVGLIRGEIGTVVKIEVLHKGDTKTTKLEIKRDVIKVPDMDTEILDDVFIIHFYSFTADSAQDFEKALQDFIKSGKTRLLVDLRGNGGGYLDSAINISSFFLPKDKVVLIEKGNKIDGDKTDYSKGFNYFNSNVLKMVILVDGYSASASEILAGALKDHDIATIVGEKTYGKGSVQQMQNFSDGSALKVTIAK